MTTPRLYSGPRVETGYGIFGTIVVPYKLAPLYWRKFRHWKTSHSETVSGYWEADLAVCEGFGSENFPDPEEARNRGLI